jgi:hypothetical protein
MCRVSLSLFLICLPLAAGNTYGKLPLSFEPNQGQTDTRVKFLARVPGYALFVTSDEAVFAGRDGSVERMKLIGANRKMRVEPLDRQPGISNYFIGNDPSKWRTNIPNYGRFALREVYPGIDLVFYSNDRQLEYDWVVAPGADPNQIGVKWEHTLREDSDGELIIGGGLRQKKPLIRQDGKAIDGGYVVRGKQVSFQVARYDATKTLVIDPVLIYSTYLAGSSIDYGQAIAVDSSGNAYVTGFTTSLNFPTANPIQASTGGSDDVFVTKMNAAGSALVYSTYLGGSGTDYGYGIAVDGSGSAYITGATGSTNFPTTSPLQSSNAGGSSDAFVTKINAAGSALVYSTYLGGNSLDEGHAIAVDAGHNAYVTGLTESTNFPTANPFETSPTGTFQAGFVTKIDAAGSAYVYSTYLCGTNGNTVGQGIAADNAGNAYVTGIASTTTFPTQNPIQASNGGGTNTDAFVTKFNPTGSALVYSTYLGGSGTDKGYGIAVDGSGNAYVTGSTTSTNFPTVSPLQASNGGGGSGNAFVTKINAAGSAFLYSTYLGGGGPDIGFGIAADGAGNAYVAGATSSTNFPVTNPLEASYGGGTSDGFVTKINAVGSTKLYSTYLGGDAVDQINGIAVGASGDAFVTGDTKSNNLPTVNPLQEYIGAVNAFVSLISGNAPGGVFRDSSGAIELTSELSTSLSGTGGDFASDPAAAQNANGDTFVVARDSSNVVWVNVYDSRTGLWDGWTSAGGTVQGMPAIAVIGDVATIAARDGSNAYWTITYTRGSGFGVWLPRGGNFATDPSIAGSGTTVYFTGKDASNSIWTATLTSGTFSAWQFDGASAAGKPGITVGVDGAAYIVIRDPSTATWMGRQAGATFNGWQPGGGSVASDPQVAGSMSKIYAVALTGSGVPWYNTFTQGTGNNWTGWQSPGGVLMDVAAAAGSGPQLFLTGRDGSNQLWWFETPGAGWKFVGGVGLAAGPLSAAPR